MLTTATIHYATPPEGYFWQWGRAYDASEWSDGRTGFLWIELQPILKFLSEDGGLPPLGSVMLLLGACREDWGATADALNAWLLQLHGGTKLSETSERFFSGLLLGLQSVRRLPKDLRDSPQAKCLLVSAVFEGSVQRLKTEVSAEIIEDLTGPGPAALAGQKADLSGMARFLRDVKGLLAGLAEQDEVSLEARLRTGLGNWDQRGVDLDVPKPEEGRELLVELQSRGGELGVVGMVAKRAIAMLNFPGKLARPPQLPVGGISDITNRGSVDRLLPGELAWDDTILAARLVHNEALYFQREVPPEEEPRKHTVYLDRGLRMWGLPRVASLGVALGLVKHPEWAADGVELHVATREGWAARSVDGVELVGGLLGELVPTADPVPSLMAWWADREEDAGGDVVVVSTASHRAKASMKACLGEIADSISKAGGQLWVIALDGSGGLVMEAWSRGGVRKIFEGEFDIEDWLNQSKVKPVGPPVLPKAESALARDYPIYRKPLLPFLFPIPRMLGTPTIATQAGLLGVSRDRRLMSWRENYLGGEEMVPKVPGSRWWLGREGNHTYLTTADVAGDPVRLYQVFPGELREVAIDRSRHSFPRHVVFSGGAMILGYQDKAEAMSLETGRRVAMLDFKSQDFKGGMSFDGRTIHLVEPFEVDADLEVEVEGLSEDETSEDWPGILVPELVGLSKGGLTLRCGRVDWRLDVMALEWQRSKVSGIGAFHFEKANYPAPEGVELKIAKIGSVLEVLHDSRGVLHVKLFDSDTTLTWSVLCFEGKSAAWNEKFGLQASERRLRRPGDDPAKNFALTLLKDLLMGPLEREGSK